MTSPQIKKQINLLACFNTALIKEKIPLKVNNIRDLKILESKRVTDEIQMSYFDLLCLSLVMDLDEALTRTNMRIRRLLYAKFKKYSSLDVDFRSCPPLPATQ